jgi:hypothetical protein
MSDGFLAVLFLVVTTLASYTGDLISADAKPNPLQLPVHTPMDASIEQSSFVRSNKLASSS